MRTTQSQIGRTRASKKDPGRHYLLVDKDDADIYLDMLSPIDPTKDMYVLDSDDRRVTGNRGLVRLSCSEEDYKALMAENDAIANGNQVAVAKNETFTKSDGLIQV